MKIKGPYLEWRQMNNKVILCLHFKFTIVKGLNKFSVWAYETKLIVCLCHIKMYFFINGVIMPTNPKYQHTKGHLF